MTGCHSCATAVDIAKGIHSEKAWEDLPCATCEVMSGASHVIEFDEGRLSPEDKGRKEVDGVDGPAEDMMPVSVMSDAMAELLTMPRELRDLICWRYSGMLYREIALVLRVSPAAVERRLKRAMKKWPALAAMFAVKAAKQKRRKPHRRHRCTKEN